MRPAYETFIEAMKKDLNRVSEQLWDRVYNQLIDLGTKEEKKYLRSEMAKLHYEYTSVVLGKLVLGITDEPENEDSFIRRMSLGRGLTRNPYASGALSPTLYESSTPIETNPNQMELDL
jgi:hypothetical protein